MTAHKIKKIKIAIINGPNLNLLGTREPNIYGKQTLTDINYALKQTFGDTHEFYFYQSNLEGELINFIHSAHELDGIVINPAAYSHTSIAIRDAIAAVGLPTVEVHMSNIFSRETYRKSTITAEACLGQICGFGAHVYALGVQALKIESNA